jgi:hypothetical protein
MESRKHLLQFLAVVSILSGLILSFRNLQCCRGWYEIAISYFLPGLALIFFCAILVSYWFFKMIDQPPIMIFILSMVIKMLASLTLLLVYLLNKKGPATEGALVFIFIYVIFEVSEIRRFVSILRPNSGNITRK